ncbi:MAG: histidinol dehydrogenase [Pseudomonadota bacterium]
MKVSVLNWAELSESERDAVLQRPAMIEDESIRQAVRNIIADVQANGDAALRELTTRFDRVDIDRFEVTSEEIDAAKSLLTKPDRRAIKTAIANVRTFHTAQSSDDIDVTTTPGVRCERLTRPMETVGLYVPAGTAPLPSAAIMMAVPAQIAGCTNTVLCAPPRSDGTVDPAILYVAKRTGVTQVFRVGGAQAIAAMAYGTESIPRVSKIFGPGNAFVAEAKSQVSADPNGAAQDLPAGPSEVLVIADESARAEVVAADLLSQAEHGEDSQVVLLCTSSELIEAVQTELQTQLEALPRSAIAAEAMTNSRLVRVASIDEAIAVSNRYAPEHLIINTRDARALLPAITNAGSVFLGPWTPESLGDYCSGTNHVLPTYGFARNYSGLGVEQFQKFVTVQEASESGLRALGPIAQTLATLENLDAHERAVRVRLESL